VLGERLLGDRTSHPEPLDPRHRTGDQGQRRLGLAPGGGKGGAGVGAELLGLQQTAGQHALGRLRHVEDHARRDRDRDREPGRVVPASPDHRRDERRQQLAFGVAGDVVDLSGELAQEGMGGCGMVAPSLTGEDRGQLHEAGTPSGRAVTTA